MIILDTNVISEPMKAQADRPLWPGSTANPPIRST